MSAPNAPAEARKEEERLRREEDLQGNAPGSPKHEEKKLDKEVKDSFPASDTPSAIQPGGGITGPEVARNR